MSRSGDISGALLEEAAKLVRGARQRQNGDKERSFEAIARLWSAYLASRRDQGAPLAGVDVAWMMVQLKIARANQGDALERDHYVDALGYAAIAGEIVLAPHEPAKQVQPASPGAFAFVSQDAGGGA